MTYFPKLRIASSMISTATTGARLRPAPACLHRDGRALAGRPQARVDHRRADSISAISISAVFRVREVSTLGIYLAAPGDRRGPAVAVAVADRMSKPNWNCLWRKRFAAAGARCRCRWLKSARLVTAPV